MMLFLSGAGLFAQPACTRFLTPADTFSNKRTVLVAGSWGGLYAGTLVGLNSWWYAGYPHSSFHFFNDAAEWQQMDKAGHAFTAYFESVWTKDALTWAGVPSKKAAWIGSATGLAFQTTLEIFDGFSAPWGASWSDVAANTAGSALALSQFLLWNDQRMTLKFSVHPVDYDASLQARANDLFGQSFAERTLKDYNGQTYWLSFNIAAWCRSEKCVWPAWLNVAAGYGADGMLGGFENEWEENGTTIRRDDVKRLRAFYLSPDIDFTKIKTRSTLLKTCFNLLNVIKIPAPALEVNSKGEWKVYAVYF